MKPSPLRPIGKAIVRIPQTYPHVYIAREPITEPIIQLDTEPARPIPVKAVKKWVKRVPEPAPAVVPAPKKMMKKIGRAVEPVVDLIRAEQAQGQIGEAVPIERGNRFMDMFQMAGGIPTSQYLNLSELPGLATSAPELATTIRALPEGLVKPRDKLDVYQDFKKDTAYVQDLIDKGIVEPPFATVSGGFPTTRAQVKRIKSDGKYMGFRQQSDTYRATFDMTRDDLYPDNAKIRTMISSILQRDMTMNQLRNILWAVDANNPDTIPTHPNRAERHKESDERELRGNAPADMLRPPLFDFTFDYGSHQLWDVRYAGSAAISFEQQKLEERITGYSKMPRSGGWRPSPIYEFIEWKP